MQDVLGYYVYNSETKQWLSDDEKTWNPSLHAAAEFGNVETANAIMEREGGDYVFACMPSP
jgi:hypothetical protein